MKAADQETLTDEEWLRDLFDRLGAAGSNREARMPA